MLCLHNNNVPVIFHRFNKKQILTQELLEKGYFSSYGKSILLSSKGEILK